MHNCVFSQVTGCHPSDQEESPSSDLLGTRSIADILNEDDSRI